MKNQQIYIRWLSFFRSDRKMLKIEAMMMRSILFFPCSFGISNNFWWIEKRKIDCKLFLFSLKINQSMTRCPLKWYVFEFVGRLFFMVECGLLKVNGTILKWISCELDFHLKRQRKRYRIKWQRKISKPKKNHYLIGPLV